MKTAALEWSFDLDAMMACRRPMLLAFTNEDRKDHAGLLAFVQGRQLIDASTGRTLGGEVVYAWAPLVLPTVDDAARYALSRQNTGERV